MSNIAVIQSIDRKTNGVFSPVPFQAESADYQCKRTKTNQGYLYKYSLSFRMAGLSAENEAELAKLAACESIRLRDVNGAEIIIGNSDIRMEVAWDETIEGKPGTFRGTKVNIELISSFRAHIRSFI